MSSSSNHDSYYRPNALSDFFTVDEQEVPQTAPVPHTGEGPFAMTALIVRLERQQLPPLPRVQPAISTHPGPPGWQNRPARPSAAPVLPPLPPLPLLPRPPLQILLPAPRSLSTRDPQCPPPTAPIPVPSKSSPAIRSVSSHQSSPATCESSDPEPESPWRPHLLMSSSEIALLVDELQFESDASSTQDAGDDSR